MSKWVTCKKCGDLVLIAWWAVDKYQGLCNKCLDKKQKKGESR